jgi:Hexameric tyrosine-coordinated heme protein (HTHP)
MSHSSSIQSLHADSPEAGLELARRLAERQLEQNPAKPTLVDMAAHLRASSAPHVTELAAQLFATVAAANGHWRR